VTDLAALPKGDQTYVGLRGVKLSGGQRARVSLGRALYSNADLLVIDDIFSALDSHVSKEILKALTGELGQGRTRILATHHVSLCLPQAKHILYLKNNTMSYSHITVSVETSFDVVEPEKSIQANASADEKPDIPTKDKPRTNTKTKTAETKSESESYKRYFSAAGGLEFAMIYVLGLLGKHFMSAVTTWTLGRIKSQRPNSAVNTLNSANVELNLWFYLYLYLLGSLSAVFLEYLSNVHVFSGSLRASEILFRIMTSNVIRMPLLWLDNTPIGAILKRFSGDMRMVDDLLLETMSEFANCIVKLMVVGYIG
jgi:ABC-type multidrug transport system fused ATPase/permease subunit